MATVSLPLSTSAPVPRAAGEPLSGIHWFWVVLFCMALLSGPAYNTFLQYDFSHTPDCWSYFQMAQGNFDVTVTHKYRIVVPLLARAVNMPLDGLYGFIWPHRNFADARVRFSFFLVNLALMSLTGLVLFRTCQAYGISVLASAVAVIGLLSSRWANYAASIPMVESFHWLCVSLVFLAIKIKDGRLLALAILLGPLSKESFLFIAPATIVFGNLRLTTQLVIYALAALAVLAVHYFIDLHFPVRDMGSVENAFRHLGNFMYSLRRIFSPAGIGENLFLLGFFNVFWMMAVCQPKGRKVWRTIDAPLLFLLASATFQALISTSIVRILCVAGPLWVVLLGKGFQHWQERPTGSNASIPEEEGEPAVEEAALNHLKAA